MGGGLEGCKELKGAYFWLGVNTSFERLGSDLEIYRKRPVGWITIYIEPLGYSDSFCWGKPAGFGDTRIPLDFVHGLSFGR